MNASDWQKLSADAAEAGMREADAESRLRRAQKTIELLSARVADLEQERDAAIRAIDGALPGLIASDDLSGLASELVSIASELSDIAERERRRAADV